MNWDVVLGHCWSRRVQGDLADNDDQHSGTKRDSECRSHTQQSQYTVGLRYRYYSIFRQTDQETCGGQHFTINLFSKSTFINVAINWFYSTASNRMTFMQGTNHAFHLHQH